MHVALAHLIVDWVYDSSYPVLSRPTQLKEELSKFICKLEAVLECPFEAFVVSAIYLLRLREVVRINPLNIEQYLLASLSLAYKFLYDNSSSAKFEHFALVGDMSNTDLSRLEDRIACTLDWKLFVTQDNFEKCYAFISQVSSSIPPTPIPTPCPPHCTDSIDDMLNRDAIDDWPPPPLPPLLYPYPVMSVGVGVGAGGWPVPSLPPPPLTCCPMWVLPCPTPPYPDPFTSWSMPLCGPGQEVCHAGLAANSPQSGLLPQPITIDQAMDESMFPDMGQCVQSAPLPRSDEEEFLSFINFSYVDMTSFGVPPPPPSFLPPPSMFQNHVRFFGFHD